MKILKFDPINETHAVNTGSDVLQALLAKDLKVVMACGGKGLCATCHVHIKAGPDKLTPRSAREERTLSFITGARPDSRLACQARVVGEGVVVELPAGMYIERAEDLTGMVGQFAAKNILHPLTGAVLIAQGKMITRSRVEELKRVGAEVDAVRRG